MTAPAPELAVSGSNADGERPFSAAVRTAAGIALALPAPDERSDLAVLVQRACAAAAVPPAGLAELRVDRGPGSYTGLRVALTFARTWCAFGGPRLLATDTLQLIASAALAADPALARRRLVPVLDGRQGRVHAAALRAGSDGVLALERAPAAIPLAGLPALLLAGDALLAGRALAPRLAEVAAATGALLAPMPAVHAAHLFAPSLAIAAADLWSLEPLYLMGSYAE